MTKRLILSSLIILVLLMILGAFSSVTAQADDDSIINEVTYDINTINGGTSTYPINYPSSYDLRSTGKISLVKEQGATENCWAFSAYTSLESSLLPYENWDFSENHMKNTHGFDQAINAGGKMNYAIAYLARWSGPVLETDDPYNPASTSSPGSLPVYKHLSYAYTYSRTSDKYIDFAKLHVLMGSAVYADMYLDKSNNYISLQGQHPTAYYCSDDSFDINHAVTIVGWDDNFDKNNFGSIKPPNNGAFLCKNSYGVDWGDGGYFWVSYYDKKLGSEMGVFIVDSIGKREYNYNYSPYGLSAWYPMSGSSAWLRNHFINYAGEKVSAVSFFTKMDNTQYYLRITDEDGSHIWAERSGIIEGSGFITIYLDEPVSIPESDYYVDVNLTTSVKASWAPVEKPIDGNSKNAVANPGESYVSTDGENWQDITTVPGYANTNVCIYAYTVKAPGTVTGVLDEASGFLASFANVKLMNVGADLNYDDNLDSFIYFETIADENGYFTFPNVPDSDGREMYRLVAYEEGYGYVRSKAFAISQFRDPYLTNYLANLQINPTSNYDADCYYDIPTTMIAGQTYQAAVKVQNVGNMVWNSGRGVVLIGEPEHDYESLIDPSLYTLPNWVSVYPGNCYTWYFSIKAPDTPGTYKVKHQMANNNNELFGRAAETEVTVFENGYSAEVIDYYYPLSVDAGQTFTASITMKNIGEYPWTMKQKYNPELGTLDEMNIWLNGTNGAELFGETRIDMAPGYNVKPGESYTWTFTMTAPTGMETEYVPLYQMFKESGDPIWFEGGLFGEPFEMRILVREPFHINSVSPVDGATNVPVPTMITARFNKGVYHLGMTDDMFTLRSSDNTLIPGTVSYDIVNKSLILVPLSSLMYGQTYHVTVSHTLMALSGEYLPEDNVWSFTTVPDTIYPVTTVNAAGTEGSTGWFKSGVTVTMSAVDTGGSGINKILYTLDGVDQAYSVPFTVSTDRDHVLTYWSVDNAGNNEDKRTLHVKIDTLPPVINIVTPLDGSSYGLNELVIANWSVSDTTSGVASAIGTVAKGSAINTSVLGLKSFTVTAVDTAGNSITKTVSYNVTYKYTGDSALMPIKPGVISTFKLGRIIPIKIQLKDANGNNITDAKPRLYIQKPGGVEIEAMPVGTQKNGNYFRYDPLKQQYVFNLDTRSMSAGEWILKIRPGDGTTKEITIRLA